MYVFSHTSIHHVNVLQYVEFKANRLLQQVARLVSVRVSFMSPVYHNVMPQRLERYDFSFVYEYGSLDFSMAPPGLQPRWQALYYPLADLVWAATLLALLLTPFILILVKCDS